MTGSKSVGIKVSPTYKEFAEFWQKEYVRRQKNPENPKKEWAYINFTQRLLKENPHASQKEIIMAWEEARRIQIEIVQNIINSFIKNQN